jgi:hypothetical protein
MAQAKVVRQDLPLRHYWRPKVMEIMNKLLVKETDPTLVKQTRKQLGILLKYQSNGWITVRG